MSKYDPYGSIRGSGFSARSDGLEGSELGEAATDGFAEEDGFGFDADADAEALALSEDILPAAAGLLFAAAAALFIPTALYFLTIL